LRGGGLGGLRGRFGLRLGLGLMIVLVGWFGRRVVGRRWLFEGRMRLRWSWRVLSRSLLGVRRGWVSVELLLLGIGSRLL
jgi:hypothetical protein